ncbi:MAG: proteasome accessory factor PafA2 family protein, partial [Verrucomicrobia bacterium]|nr:proteasome accessory factor PafA2 family protein [Verrucomicrobiota bacterium]
FQAAQHIADDDPWLQALDLEYHRLDPGAGLYYGLEKSGAMLGVPDEAAVQRAVFEPPLTTRAFVRGKCIQKFTDAVVSAQWDHLTLEDEHGLVKISLMDLFAPEDLLRYRQAVDAARAPDDLRRFIFGK